MQRGETSVPTEGQSQQGQEEEETPTHLTAVLFQWSVFPLILVGSVAGTLFLVGRGYSPEIAIFFPMVASLLLVALLERIFAFHDSWNENHADLAADTGHATLSYGFVVIVNALFRVMLVAATGPLAATIGLYLWPSDWHLVAQLALALVVGEFPMYWVHRLEHETELLWRVHAVHHSSKRLYWLNTLRFHPIDLILNGIPSIAVLVMVGVPEIVLALFSMIQLVHGVMQHGNLQVRCGPLNWIFSMAELHRWHHMPSPVESNHNYGQTMIFWDIVFGTRWLPTDRTPSARIGIETLPYFPTSYWAHLLTPFRWQAVVQASSAIQNGIVNDHS